ncbi:MAG: flagellar type III secretion system pore protein FliP [Acidobacteriota bacterium]
MRIRRLIAILMLAAFLWPVASFAAPSNPVPGVISINLDSGNGRQSLSIPIQILLLLTVLTFIPAILVSVTSFTRIVIVFHFLRQALGTAETPSNQLMLGLSLFLTFFIMAPVGERINQEALQPMLSGQLSQGDALERGLQPLRGFMMKYTREKDLALFLSIAKKPRPRNADDVPTHVMIPAFIISELKTAFQIGTVLFLPFLVIDMVVATVLLSMGMMQLPPVMVSMPFKILLFIMVDGWNLVVGSLVKSFF